MAYKEFNIAKEISNKAFNMIKAEIDILASAASNQRKEFADALIIKNQKLQKNMML